MATITCPRCFAEIQADPAPGFCPHCGLSDVAAAAADHAPMDVAGHLGTYRVLGRLAIGSVTSLYRCQIPSNPSGQIGVFKIARDHRGNDAVTNEAAMLRHLASETPSPFVPMLIDSFPRSGAASEPLRQANVLVYHPQIHSPDELYSLVEVAAAYPDGLDARHVAWIWRRVLNVLGFVHSNGVAHCAVLPEHILIEPRDHKLVLIDWCFAGARDRWNEAAQGAGIGPFRKWYQRNYWTRPSSPALDISLAAHCMVYLLDGGIAPVNPPQFIDPALRRHFERCIDIPTDPHPSAFSLLEQFDQLIEALWGPRQFIPLTLPPR